MLYAFVVELEEGITLEQQDSLPGCRITYTLWYIVILILEQLVQAAGLHFNHMTRDQIKMEHNSFIIMDLAALGASVVQQEYLVGD
jgi:hypothetical protein